MLGLLTLLLGMISSDIQIEGWTIRLGAGVIEDPSWEPAKSELTRQLQSIKRKVRDEPLAKLQKVTIWANIDSKITPCMAYHPSRDWLAQHDANPNMAKGIELGSTKNFVSWTYEQPWMVMHELAHAYHDQFLEKGFSNSIVKAAYDQALQSKKYESVMHYDGALTKHYALTDPMEFFAETTESYFGTNDFYPFVQAELKSFDANAFQLMKQIWGPPLKRKKGEAKSALILPYTGGHQESSRAGGRCTGFGQLCVA